jgi:hypothetical protein
MNWMAKTRPAGATAASAAPAKPGPSSHASAAVAPNSRASNGLKEFLWLISDVPRGRVLDLGPIYQSTLNFFVEKGYRVSSEDILRAWKDFLTAEEESLRIAPAGDGWGKLSPSALASKFLETALQYPAESFHGVLAWDLFDYFDPEAVPSLVQRLSSVVHPGGAVLALFHSHPAQRFHRYRILDKQTIELVPAPTIAVHTRVFQNRELLGLFEDFRSSKSFVGRDQVREALFVK